MTDYFFCNCTITTWQFMNIVTTYFRWGSCFLDYLTLCWNFVFLIISRVNDIRVILVLMIYKVLERMYMLQVVVFCWCCVCVLSMAFVTDTPCWGCVLYIICIFLVMFRLVYVWFSNVLHTYICVSSGCNFLIGQTIS